MTDNRLSGLALIVGSVGMIITMVLHPSGHIAAAQMERTIRMLIAVHSLALACLPIVFLGAWGLSRRLASPDRLAFIGAAFYTFALFAVMNAAVADGLITPMILRQIVASAGVPVAIDSWQIVARYNFFTNQGYAQVYVVASIIAILLWSAAIWRNRILPRGLAIYGFILGLATLLALFSGHLNLDAHGFGLIVFGQAAWLIIAGRVLLSHGEVDTNIGHPVHSDL
jgi:hypothetical protein